MALVIRNFVLAQLFVLYACGCQGALSESTGRESVELHPCTVENDVPCIMEDDTTSMTKLRNNATVNVEMKLPTTALNEALLEPSKLAIVSIDLDIIRGRQLTSHESYGERLDIKWNIELMTNEWGLLKLSLFLRDIEFKDTRLLHLEVRTDTAVYKTKGTAWFNVVQEVDPPAQIPNDAGDKENSDKGVPDGYASKMEFETMLYEELSKQEQKITAVQRQNYLILQHNISTTEQKVNEMNLDFIQSEAKFSVMVKMILTFCCLWTIVGVPLIAYCAVKMYRSKYKQDNISSLNGSLSRRDIGRHVFIGLAPTGTIQALPSKLPQCTDPDKHLVLPPGYRASIKFSETETDISTESGHLLQKNSVHQLQYELFNMN